MKLLASLLVASALAAGPGGMAPLPPEGGVVQGVGPDPSSIVGQPAGPPLTGAALQAQTREVGSLLRCVVCQGLSVADSPSDTARAMRDEVREMVAAGYDKEQILTYFEASYGEFVLLQPKLDGFNWLVWTLPVAVLLGGGGLIAWTIRKRAGSAPTRAAPPTLAEEEDEYLRRVRQELQNDRGGK